MLLGISGLAGSGKDTVGLYLAELFNTAQVSFADPLKRVARDIYDFSEEQLWGPSELRSKPDKRYPREHTWADGSTCVCCGYAAPATLLRSTDKHVEESFYKPTPQCYLTPRYVLQLLGTEWGRHCYSNTWVLYGLRVTKELLEGNAGYSAQHGIRQADYSHTSVAILDVRFKNEIAGIREENGLLVRVKRKGYEHPRWNHPSETEQLSIPDSAFHYVLHNDAGLDDLKSKTAEMMEVLRGRIWT